MEKPLVQRKPLRDNGLRERDAMPMAYHQKTRQAMATPRYRYLSGSARTGGYLEHRRTAWVFPTPSEWQDFYVRFPSRTIRRIAKTYFIGD